MTRMPALNDLELDELIATAYHTERVASRRLARRDGISEWQALRHTLEQAAGTAGLPELLAARRQDRQAETERLLAKTQRKAAQLALKQAGHLPPPGAWLGWFDGSAHPNPGKIGIGALLAGPAGERIAISRRAGYGNSGEAEYGALIALMEAALQARAGELVVYGDSQVVINDLNRITAGAAKGLESQREQAGELMRQLGKVTLLWVPRHKNGEADRLSQQAVALWKKEEQDAVADLN